MAITMHDMKRHGLKPAWNLSFTAPQPATSSQATNIFFALPPEIRNKIYEMILWDLPEGTLVLCSSLAFRQGQSGLCWLRTILTTSKQFYSEFYSLLIENCPVHVLPEYHLYGRSIRPAEEAAITSFTICDKIFLGWPSQDIGTQITFAANSPNLTTIRLLDVSERQIDCLCIALEVRTSFSKLKQIWIDAHETVRESCERFAQFRNLRGSNDIIVTAARFEEYAAGSLREAIATRQQWGAREITVGWAR